MWIYVEEDRGKTYARFRNIMHVRNQSSRYFSLKFTQRNVPQPRLRSFPTQPACRTCLGAQRPLSGQQLVSCQCDVTGWQLVEVDVVVEQLMLSRRGGEGEREPAAVSGGGRGDVHHRCNMDTRITQKAIRQIMSSVLMNTQNSFKYTI